MRGQNEDQGLPPASHPRLSPPAISWLLLLVMIAAWPALPVRAQGLDPTGRPIASIRIAGLEQVPEQLVRNQIRSRTGEPYDPDTVNGDIVRISSLGRFESVTAEFEQLPDGSIALVFQVREQPLLTDVQVVGNSSIPDQELLGRVLLRTGDPADPFLINRGRQQIIEAYEDKGYFVADVTVDQDLLEESGILLYRVREGPRVRIRAFEFEGNDTFSDRQLKSQIQSKAYFPIFRSGALNRQELELDAGRIRDFYRDRGYLEAQADRDIRISPDQRDAVVVFLIEEGPQYLVDTIRVEGNEVFPDEQILLNMELRAGDVYAANKRRQSQQALRELYGKLGYLDTNIEIIDLFNPDRPTVDVVVRIEENRSYTVGSVSIRGNELTKSHVVLRQVRGMTPGRPFDRAGVDETERRLRENSLFADATVTILGEPEDQVRDVLIQVQETNTGSILFGAGVSSDLGVLGAVNLTQRNFDIADYPEDFEEFITGRAFRGAGQFFSLNLSPGTENSRYSLNFREPYLLETEYFLDTSVFFFTSEREDFDETRWGGSFGLGQRFGDVWRGSIRTRFNRVTIDQIEADAPVDVFDVEGDSDVTGLGFVLERSTTDSFIFPTEGNRWEFGVERVGALGGDFDFTRLRTEFRQFWTVDEDFFGRRTVLSWRVEIGYILESDEAPIFERFFAGGHRSFRGFDFRGVGPRGIRADTRERGDDPVGADWLLLTGLEYNFPLWEEVIRGVVFTDMGTVTEDLGFDDWRVSVGAGFRIKLPFLGQAPFALDFAIPVLRQDDDDERLISFDLALPFN